MKRFVVEVIADDSTADQISSGLAKIRLEEEFNEEFGQERVDGGVVWANRPVTVEVKEPER